MKNYNLTFILVLLACNSPSKIEVEEELVYPVNQVFENIDTLKMRVVEYGDTQAFYILSTHYLSNIYEEELLFYALIMANKYDFHQGYYDVYYCLTSTYFNNIVEIDEHTAKLALEYLLKACQKGHHQAIERVKKYTITDTKNSKQKLIEIYGD